MGCSESSAHLLSDTSYLLYNVSFWSMEVIGSWQEDNACVCVTVSACVCGGSVCNPGFSSESSCSKEFSGAHGGLRGITRKYKVTHLFFWKATHAHACAELSCMQVERVLLFNAVLAKTRWRHPNRNTTPSDSNNSLTGGKLCRKSRRKGGEQKYLSYKIKYWAHIKVTQCVKWGCRLQSWCMQCSTRVTLGSPLSGFKLVLLGIERVLAWPGKSKGKHQLGCIRGRAANSLQFKNGVWDVTFGRIY